MHFSTVASTVAVLASMAAAQPTTRQAPVAYANLMVHNLNDHSQQPVRIPLAQLTTLNYHVTQMDLISLSVHVPGIPSPDVKDIVCQRYADKYGIQIGSAEFSEGKPALLSTNPVDFGWVLCYHKNKSS
ncbi:hypothetical protein FGRMN_8574 [Fusarium graminum]|nr:hypothetical protein FGRMN_8574 [Fusarium graminum]